MRSFLLFTLMAISAAFLTGCGATTGTQTAPPQNGATLSLTPTSIDFGTITVGSNSTQSVTATANSGSVTINSASVTGSGFSISGITFPVTVASGQSVSLLVTFGPETSGAAAGSIQFVLQGSTTDPDVSLTGVGTVAATNYTISGSLGSAGSGATVNVTGAGSETAIADGNGNYVLGGLSNGSYTVTPAKTGVTFTPASQPVTVNGSDVSNVNFTAQTTGTTHTISGTLTAGGGGATVALSGTASSTSTADSNGNYSFTGLSNGSYSVTPSKAGITFSPVSQSVTVSGSDVSGINFSERFNLSGSLGSAGSGATVSLSGAATASTTADSNGNFSFSGLAAGSYTVTPTKSGLTFSPASRTVSVTSANVIGVNFSELWTVTGTLGAGGSGASVSLSGGNTATVTADANGNFSFANVANGSYTVTPSKAGIGFSPASRSVTVNGANVSGLTFTETYSISGSVTTTGSGATITLSGAASATTTADSNGNFSFSGLQNGSYTVTPSKSGATFTPSSQSVLINGANASANFTTSGTSSHSVTLSWVASSTPNVTYNVYRCTASATACTAAQMGNFQKIASSLTIITYLDTNVSSGQTYYYGVTAVDSNQNESTMSNVASGTIP